MAACYGGCCYSCLLDSQRKSLAKTFMRPLGLCAMDNSIWNSFMLPLKNYVTAVLAANFSKIGFLSVT